MAEVVCRDWHDFETMEPCEQAVGTEGYVVWKASVAELWYGQHVAELAIRFYWTHQPLCFSAEQDIEGGSDVFCRALIHGRTLTGHEIIGRTQTPFGPLVLTTG